MRRYSGDPHEITARYPGTCAGRDCGAAIAPGDRCFYFPKGRKLYKWECHGEAAYHRFMSESADEDIAAGYPGNPYAW